MWRMTTRLATAFLPAFLALALASDARGSAVMTYSYSTSGSVGAPDTSVGNAPSVGPIGFDGVSTGSLTSPSFFSLGVFTVAPLPPSASVTYDHTPYTIYLTGFGTGFIYRVDGVLNGVGKSSMTASVTTVMGWATSQTDSSTPISLDDLKIVAPLTILAPANYLGSRTSLLGQIAPGIGLPTPAPEPASVAIVAVGLAAWGLKRRLRPRTRPAA